MELKEIVGTKIKEVIVGEKTIVLILERESEAETPNTIDNYVPMRKKRKKTGLPKGTKTKGKFTKEI